MYYATTFPCCVVRIIVGMTTWSLDELIEPLKMTPTKRSCLQPPMWDAPVQPPSHAQTPERRLRCCLHMYRNTVTSVTSRVPSQGRIYSPRSPEVFPVYVFPSHVEESSWVYYRCSSCRWDSCRICPSAQSGASFSLHEISLCHLMYSGSLQHYVLQSLTQKNEAAEIFFDCGWRSVVFSTTEAMNKAEHYNLYVTQTSLESFYENRHFAALFWLYSSLSPPDRVVVSHISGEKIEA